MRMVLHSRAEVPVRATMIEALSLVGQGPLIYAGA